MSQSATLYRISKDIFEKLGKSENYHQINIPSVAKNYSTLDGSFMALEFILSKDQDERTKQLITQIFEPDQYIGIPGFENLPHEEQMEFYASGGFIHFLEPATVSAIHDHLDKISAADIPEKYNAEELNNNGIYPSVWHNDNSPANAFNEQHVIDDLIKLKDIFKLANEANEYILSFVG